MERRLLSDEEIVARLRALNGWSEEDGKLVRKYKFSNFGESLEFVNRVGKIAEESDHHPDITFGWGYARVATTTHDRGGVTDVDFAFAEKINAIS